MKFVAKSMMTSSGYEDCINITDSCPTVNLRLWKRDALALADLIDRTYNRVRPVPDWKGASWVVVSTASATRFAFARTREEGVAMMNAFADAIDRKQSLRFDSCDRPDMTEAPSPVVIPAGKVRYISIREATQ